MKTKFKDLAPGSWFVRNDGSDDLYVVDNAEAAIRFRDGGVLFPCDFETVTFVKSVVVEYEL